MRTWLVLFALMGCVEDADPTGDDSATDSAPVDARPTDARPTDARPTDARPTDARPTDATDPNDAGPPDATTSRVPAVHRATATACDRERPSEPPDPTPEQAECLTHEECVEGINGRCLGNSHDGWRCTYDLCFSDTECDNVCACGGGFRSDHNLCIGGNCRVDGDCGPGGFCSPSLGGCGFYDKFVGYWCHTAADTCLDDADCVTAPGGSDNSYCAYDPATAVWACSDSQCAGK